MRIKIIVYRRKCYFTEKLIFKNDFNKPNELFYNLFCWFFVKRKQQSLYFNFEFLQAKYVCKLPLPNETTPMPIRLNPRLSNSLKLPVTNNTSTFKRHQLAENEFIYSFHLPIHNCLVEINLSRLAQRIRSRPLSNNFKLVDLNE